MQFFVRKRADDVLEKAKQVVQALTDADVAQEKAKLAIKKATEDISLAADDLEQVRNRSSIGIYRLEVYRIFSIIDIEAGLLELERLNGFE